MNEPMTNRREFLATVGAAGAASMLAGPWRLGQASPPRARRNSPSTAGRRSARTRSVPGPTGPSSTTTSRSRNCSKSSSRGSRSAGGAAESKVLQFEKAYAAHIGVKYAMGVTSGTTALYTAMAALEIGPGDEVILPAWTWYADYDAVVLSRRPAGVRRDRRIAGHRSQGHRGPDHAAHQGDRAVATSRAARPTWTRSWRSPANTSSAWWKTAPSAAADATRGSSSARSATSASTASSSARRSPRAKAAP